MRDPAPAPLQLTLYDENEEAIGTFTRSRISWGVLKKAVQLSGRIGDPDQISTEDIDAIAGLVAEAFGNQFTVEQLDKGADIGEMMAVLQAIVARAGAIVAANPTPPSATLPRGRKK